MSALFLPTTPGEVLALLQRHPGARLLAGGTDLLVQWRRTAPQPPPPLIGVTRVPEWQGVCEDAQGLWIGACTPVAHLMGDPRLNSHAPALVAALRCLGGPALRNMATLGGNLCTASPAGDSLPPLHVLDAQLELVSTAGCRQIPVHAWMTGPGRTLRRDDEILTRIHLPRSAWGSRQRFDKVGQRRSMAISVVSFAGAMNVQDDGLVYTARFAWGSAGPTIVQIPEVESLLQGQRLCTTLAREAADIAARSVAPISDLRGTAAYRRALAGQLLQRFLVSFHG